MKSTQQVISRNQSEKSVEELLDGSVKIQDFCGITRDTVFQIKENVQALHSALRRRKGDSSAERSVSEYNVFMKKMKKNAKKMMVGLKQLESRFRVTPLLNLDNHLGAVFRVIREVIGMNISILQSLLSFLALWGSENVNELQNVDSALSTLLSDGGNINSNGEKMKGARERLKALEITIESLENGLESVFRRLIKTRAFLLNIISQ